MPLYEYACEKCGKRFEVMQKFSDDPLTVHADCGGHVERLISAPAFHFKGSGWYVNDYAKEKKSDKNGPAKSDGAGDKSPESKNTSSESKGTSSDSGDKSTGSTPASSTPASSSTDSK